MTIPEVAIVKIRAQTAEARRHGLSIGLIPTMGALHEGHGALIRRAREETGYVVVSIFVNPIQFDRQDDLDCYPRPLDADLEYCRRLAVDAVFAPAAAEMYPDQHQTMIEAPDLSRRLEGEFRPGHFRGVATVVAKLFNIVQPDRAYFGEKDAQQLAVIQKMVADLNIPVTIVPVPIVREPDGLAISSRNQRLTPEERRVAPALYQALHEAESLIRGGCNDAAAVRRAALAMLARTPQIRVEYLEVIDPSRFETIERIDGPVRVAAAVWLGQVRLIDNVMTARGDSR